MKEGGVVDSRDTPGWTMCVCCVCGTRTLATNMCIFLSPGGGILYIATKQRFDFGGRIDPIRPYRRHAVVTK